MNNINNQIVKFSKVNQLLILGLTLVSVPLAFSFWQYDLAIYDSAGHVALVEQIAANFWPFLSGWNANQLLGWPQGIYYPSAFHWLAATLSFSFGVEASVKTLISFSITILPISVYWYSASVIKNNFWAILATISLFLLILIFPNFLGSGYRSLFQIGLLSNFFALPFVFIFLASIHKEWNYKISSLILAFLVLTHIVAAMVAGVYFLIFIVGKRFIEKDRSIANQGKLIVLVLLLTLFFWVPLILNLEFTSVSRHVPSYLWTNIVVFFISLIFLRDAIVGKKTNNFILSVFIAIFSFLAIADTFLIGQFGTSFILYPFHIYRFQPFNYLLLAILAFLVVSKWKSFDLFLKKAAITNTLLLGAFVVVILTLLVRNPADIAQEKYEISIMATPIGRFVENFRRSRADPYWYGFQEGLAMNKSTSWAYGLFTDSTPNGPFIGSLIKSLNPEIYDENEEVFIETKFVDEERIESIVNYFGINYSVSLEEEPLEVIGTLQKGEEQLYYNAKKVSNSELFEIMTLTLDPVEEGWDKAVEEWWFAQGSINSIPVKGKNDEITGASVSNSNVSVVESNQEGTKFKLNVDSKKPVPVMAKISYFPYWKATSNGNDIKIYRAAPNLMIFFADGEVELEYKEPLLTKIMVFVSLFSWLIVVVLLIFKPWITLGKKM